MTSSHDKHTQNNPEEDELGRDLTRYMKSLTDTFARFEEGLKHHETFGKQLLNTVAKVNSQKIDIFEILNRLTKEVSGLGTRLDHIKKEVGILKARGSAKQEKGAGEATGHRSRLSGGDDLPDSEGDGIYARSKKAFREIDSIIDEKAGSKQALNPEAEQSLPENDFSDTLKAVETKCAQYCERLTRQINHVKELEQTMTDVNDRKKNAMESFQENSAIVIKLQGKLDAMREKLEAHGAKQKKFLSNAQSNKPASPGNDASFDGAKPDSDDSNPKNMDIKNKLKDGAKAIKLYRFKEKILRQKVDMYINEFAKIEQERNEAKDNEQTLLKEYDDYMVKIREALTVPDEMESILAEIKSREKGAPINSDDAIGSPKRKSA